MQRERTKITVRSDYPTSVASSAFGSNINCMAFNLDYIGKLDPELAKKVTALYEQCIKLKHQPIKEVEYVSN